MKRSHPEEKEESKALVMPPPLPKRRTMFKQEVDFEEFPLCNWGEEKIKLWNQGKRDGTFVEGTVFVPVRVPLSTAFTAEFNSISIEQFTITDFVEQQISKRVSIGLALDVTLQNFHFHDTK